MVLGWAAYCFHQECWRQIRSHDTFQAKILIPGGTFWRQIRPSEFYTGALQLSKAYSLLKTSLELGMRHKSSRTVGEKGRERWASPRPARAAVPGADLGVPQQLVDSPGVVEGAVRKQHRAAARPAELGSVMQAAAVVHRVAEVRVGPLLQQQLRQLHPPAGIMPLGLNHTGH